VNSNEYKVNRWKSERPETRGQDAGFWTLDTGCRILDTG